MVQSARRESGIAIRPQRIHGRAGLTAVAGLACAFGLSGCGLGGGGAKSAVTFAKGPADDAARQYAKVSLEPALERFSARSVLVEGGQSRPLITVPTEAEAAAAVRESPALAENARASAANVDNIVSETTTDGAARTKIKACFKGAATTAAGRVAKQSGEDWLDGRALSVELEPMIVPAFSSCLQKAYPDAAPLTRTLGRALTRAMLAPSNEVSETDATAQDYVDWLLYSAALAAESDVDTAPAETEVTPSPTEASMDDLLVVVSHAHLGRLAVRRGEWQAAIANREAVIEELEALDVAPALEHSRNLLMRAMRTSLRSDHEHAECGARCAAPFDRRATARKQAFVREYHPHYAKKYPGRLDHRDF